MKRKDVRDLVHKEKGELEKLAHDISLEIGKLKLEMKLNKVKNLSLISEKKKDYARILTQMRMKEIKNG
ncbi:MAG: hypothetical protein UU37_C0002G0026 [Candidatus Gottesmanbacteria bacterium GW2011_GWA2_41_12]|uniref:Large ribosomal subunit protein uL29 n=2 Tax=Candidatus Gottesmaniibacteriota TaxID=1752720 RepID=A0A0G0ULU8_9BACT|nr:MAG: hypothetical protein UT63_C0013G0013 [Candidatus Gottesmanbacteria bacterium GW2011_GWC2_39_8]KKR88511.1 MAG: hypothetical protein UU37_C0002G0026 [Candidatus Gottesmanbacteria bacterium GW2011_GWA2_41_12]